MHTHTDWILFIFSTLVSLWVFKAQRTNPLSHWFYCSINIRYQLNLISQKLYLWMTQAFRLNVHLYSLIYLALKKNVQQTALKLTNYSNSTSTASCWTVSDMYGQIFALPRANSLSCYSKDYFLTLCRLYCWVADGWERWEVRWRAAEAPC